MKKIYTFFRKLFKNFDTETFSIKGEVYRIFFLFSMAIFIGMSFSVLLGQATGILSSLHWSIRILFEDFDSLENFDNQIYPFAFFLKLSGHMLIPVIITLLTAKVLSVHFFKPTAKHLKNHLVIYGRVLNVPVLVDQLWKGGIDDMVFISQMEPIHTLPLEVRVVFLKQSSDLASNLELAHIHKARYLLVTCKENELEKDFKIRAVMTIVMARNLNRNLHIVVEASGSTPQNFFKTLGAHEVIRTEEILPSLTSLCLLQNHFSSFVREIITTGMGNTLAILPLPSFLEGMSFTEALLECKEKENWILLGVKRKDHIYTNPWKFILEKEDLLFLVQSEELF